MAKRSSQPGIGRTTKNMDHSKIASELADRELAATATLPFSIEEILQKLSDCKTEEEQGKIWNYLDKIVPTLSVAQIARFRVEFADSLNESSHRVEEALAHIAEKYDISA